MVKIYDQTKITNLIITQEFITNTDETIITNNITKEEITIIKDEEKDKQFVDFVNTDLDQETVKIFGLDYPLEEFSFN